MKYCLPFVLLLFLFGCDADKPSQEKTSQTPDDTTATVVDTVPEKSSQTEPLVLPEVDRTPLELVPQQIIADGDTFYLNLPKGYRASLASTGMKRIRFMDMAPDGRLFLTDMYNLADNTRGKIYILNGWDKDSMKFTQRHIWQENLRNPNSLSFYRDNRGKDWIYVALTDKLVRYPYNSGEMRPSAREEIIARFPDYGADYRKGGWHLTRTIQFGDNGKMYISVGSSCNACIEKEEVRAVVLEMNPDGSDKKIFAEGVRNAVGLEWVNGHLFATFMGVDHLGQDSPEEVIYALQRGQHYGWPYCYPEKNKMLTDPQFQDSAGAVACADVPEPFTYLGPHAAPLGISYFPQSEHNDPALAGYFLVALHGPYSPNKNRGYKVVRLAPDGTVEPFITGFLENRNVYGRPCGIYPQAHNAFFLSDDKFGRLYYVWKE